jgi:hypothetical protein
MGNENRSRSIEFMESVASDERFSQACDDFREAIFRIFDDKFRLLGLDDSPSSVKLKDLLLRAWGYLPLPTMLDIGPQYFQRLCIRSARL